MRQVFKGMSWRRDPEPFVLAGAEITNIGVGGEHSAA